MVSSQKILDAHIRSSKLNQQYSCVVDTPSMYRKSLPYLMQAVKQGLQDIGASSIAQVHDQVSSGAARMEVRSSGAQAEGNVHDMHSYSKKLW